MKYIKVINDSKNSLLRKSGLTTEQIVENLQRQGINAQLCKRIFTKEISS